MEAHRENIKKEYPEILTARALMVQQDYLRASEIYSKILESLSETQEGTPEISIVYMEYAKSLIMSSDKIVINPEIEEDKEYLEDLEIAWECLEISKNIFKAHNAEQELLEVLLLLGELSQDSNNYLEAKNDYLEALSILRRKNKVYECLELSFRVGVLLSLLDEKEKALKMFHGIIEEAKTKENTEELVEEVTSAINELLNPSQNEEKKNESLPVDPQEPVKRIEIRKTKK
ncbi:hypothetical protein NEFER03_0883 [Nematocida sp. LUAm3]|nr:hypothetical protein NEFER03_0883 [Nematocida sp. LUAm3]KAI5174901.1 hypothetical protein NEFER02_1001 [Nematocida sp. LUAm2]KAI5177501.1 hypothetical protein NEFER01_0751 [Nematocida sp. LUAm1]